MFPASPGRCSAPARLTGLLAVLLALLLAAPGAIPVQGARPLLVFAAASLRNALDDVVAGYPGDHPVVSYAGTATLARHIERGAPAALLIAADREWMDYLERRRLLAPGTRRDLLGNRLVLIAPAHSALRLAIEPGMALAGALGDGRLAIADAAHVPAGRYARAALESLGVWASVEARTAAVENVRLALALVARGEAPLGIVYATDALAEPRVRTLGEFDPALHPRIVYPMALVGADDARARAFAAHLRGEVAQRIFERHGFTPLN